MATTLIGSTWIAGRGGSVDDDNNREFTRAFVVSTSGPEAGASAVLQTAGLPAIGEFYAGEDGSGEFDAGAVARRITPRQDSVAPNLWVVEVTYSVKPLADNGGNPNAGNPAQQNPDPLARPAQWEISFAQYQRPITDAYLLNDAGDYLNVDEDDNPISESPTNSAYKPFDPPPTRDDARVVLTITRNEPWPASVAVARAYMNAVNSDTFFGAPAGQAQMKGIRARNAYEPSIGPFITVTYEIHFREGHWDGDNWNLNLLDMGFDSLDLSGDPQPIMRQGMPLSAPVLLNGFGQVLDPPDSGQSYRRYQIYPRLPFAPLGLE